MIGFVSQDLKLCWKWDNRKQDWRNVPGIQQKSLSNQCMMYFWSREIIILRKQVLVRETREMRLIFIADKVDWCLRTVLDADDGNVRWTGGSSGWWRRLPSGKPNFQRGLAITSAVIVIYPDENIINDNHKYHPLGHYYSHPQGCLDQPDKERNQVWEDAGDVSWSSRCRCAGDLLRDCLSGVQVVEFPLWCFSAEFIHSGALFVAFAQRSPGLDHNWSVSANASNTITQYSST